MNVPNALAFAALGWVMEMLPKAFPSWFPHNGSDGANTRALWLGVMGYLQLMLGLGHILHSQVWPSVIRLVSLVPSGEPGALPLPSPRGVTPR
jgi:hypothetical protein